MSLEPKSNFAYGTLSGSYSDSATSLTLNTGEGAYFPDADTEGSYHVVIMNETYRNARVALDAGELEVVNVTADSGDTLTVQRGQRSTTAIAFTSGKTWMVFQPEFSEDFADIETLIDKIVDVTKAEIDILDGATLTTAELNTLDGVTSTTAEINKLDGFTGDVSDLNGTTEVGDAQDLDITDDNTLSTQKQVADYNPQENDRSSDALSSYSKIGYQDADGNFHSLTQIDLIEFIQNYNSTDMTASSVTWDGSSSPSLTVT